MNVYIVRHGQTELNAKQMHQDHTGRLSETGIEQAKRLALRFRSIPIDLIVASVFDRARHTAEIVNEGIGKNITYTPLLVEVKRPTVLEGKLYDAPDVVAVKRELFARFHDPNYRHSDEETFIDLRDRAAIFIHHLHTLPVEHILLVTHGEFAKVLVSVMLFGPEIDPKVALQFYTSIKMTNTGITVCEYANDKWQLITWNDQTHLGEM